MNSPPNPTISDITSNGRDRIGKPFMTRTNQQHLVSRLSSFCQEISLHRHLELHVQSQRGHDYRPPVPVISGIVDVLQAERRINPPPNMERVIRFDDVLAPVVKAAIAEKKTGATEREVFLMIARDAVRNEYQPGTVEFSMPRLAVAAGADAVSSTSVYANDSCRPSFHPHRPNTPIQSLSGCSKFTPNPYLTVVCGG